MQKSTTQNSASHNSSSWNNNNSNHKHNSDNTYNCYKWISFPEWSSTSIIVSRLRNRWRVLRWMDWFSWWSLITWTILCWYWWMIAGSIITIWTRPVLVVTRRFLVDLPRAILIFPKKNFKLMAFLHSNPSITTYPPQLSSSGSINSNSNLV